MIEFNVNTDAVVKFTAKLEKLHKSAFPSAVRGTLNKLAFDVKTNTMPTIAAKTFEKRQPNFFKANSKFENASGFDVSSMKATVGFVSTSLKGTSNYAVDDLEQQEFGGTIKRRSFIPMKPARIGNSSSKMVRANARLGAIKRVVDSRNASGKNEKEKFRKSVYHAGVGGLVLGNKTPRILWRAIAAVFNSWENPRAVKYREIYDIPHNWGTAVNVQSMVFGNITGHSKVLQSITL